MMGTISAVETRVAHLDRWLRNNAPALIAFNAAHNGQLWVTFDEGAGSNQTVFAECVGLGCVAGKTLATTYSQGHYSLLRYIESNFNVPLFRRQRISYAHSAVRLYSAMIRLAAIDLRGPIQLLQNDETGHFMQEGKLG